MAASLNAAEFRGSEARKPDGFFASARSTRPFHEKHGESVAGGAGYMLDLIEEGAFVATGNGRLEPVSKIAVFREFMAPLDLEEEIAARDAEVALAFLVEQGMVEVAGDEITVPASFWSGGQPLS